eukprot:scaffold399685_cov19-Prasinocladus_malaysianus.AAC.1
MSAIRSVPWHSLFQFKPLYFCQFTQHRSGSHCGHSMCFCVWYSTRLLFRGLAPYNLDFTQQCDALLISSKSSRCAIEPFPFTRSLSIPLLHCVYYAQGPCRPISPFRVQAAITGQARLDPYCIIPSASSAVTSIHVLLHRVGTGLLAQSLVYPQGSHSLDAF